MRVGEELWIGVTAKSGAAAWVAENTKNYLAVLRAQGAVPVVLSPDVATTLPDGTTFPPDDQGRLPDALLDRLDGLILSGGGDVHPQLPDIQVSHLDPEVKFPVLNYVTLVVKWF